MNVICKKEKEGYGNRVTISAQHCKIGRTQREIKSQIRKSETSPYDEPIGTPSMRPRVADYLLLK